MASTPFAAVSHLSRATTPNSDPAARPRVMTLVMAVPTMFWVNANADVLRPFAYNGRMEVLLVGVPALLSIWLLVTFALLAWRGPLTHQF